MITNFKLLIELESQIRYHNFLYYVADRPEISNTKYDSLVLEYEKLKSETPEYMSENKITGLPVKGTVFTFPITEPMLGIKQLPTREKFFDWCLKENNGDVVYEPKLDGFPVRIVYLDGDIHHLHTKGDGKNGQDISHRLHLFKDVPNFITLGKKHHCIEITGIAYCLNQDLKDYCLRHDLDTRVTKNRSLVANLLKRSHSTEVDDLPIYFKALNGNHSLLKEFDDYYDFKVSLVEMGFDPIETLTNEDVTSLLEGVTLSFPQTKYPDLYNGNIPLTGIIAKSNNLDHWVEEQKSDTFTYARSYTFPTITLKMKTSSVEWDLNEQGYLVGYLILAPMDEDSSQPYIKVGFPHPESYLEQGLKIDASVEVIKDNAGKYKFVDFLDLGKGRKIVFPDLCPYCQSVMVKEKKGFIRCINESCDGQLNNKLLRLVSIKGLNISALTGPTIDQLIEHGFLSNLSDIFKLKVEDFINIDIDEEIGKQVIFQIENTNQCELFRWLYSLSISRLGIPRSIFISNHFFQSQEEQKLETLIEYLTNAGLTVEHFGLDGLAITHHVVDRLDSIKEFLSYYDFENETHTALNKIPVAISGAWSPFTRSELERELITEGYILENNVTTDVLCLLTGEYPSPGKVEFAAANEIPILDIRKFPNIDDIKKALKK